MFALKIQGTMSKTLFILRHAQTESFSESGQDFDRALTLQGMEDAQKLRQLFVEKGWSPQKIYCSSAMRTRQTWQELGLSQVEPLFRDSIYLASCGDLMAELNQLPDEVESLLLIGHNPGLHQLVQALSGNVLAGFSPASLAVLSGEWVSWQNLEPGTMRLQELVTV